MTRPPAPPSTRVPGFTRMPEGEGAAPASGIRSAGPRGIRQLNVRVDAALLDRYRRLLRECEDAGVTIAMTELVHALLHGGPSTVDEVRALVRAYRRAHEDV